MQLAGLLNKGVVNRLHLGKNRAGSEFAQKMVRHLVAPWTALGGALTKRAAVAVSLGVICWRIRGAGRAAVRSDRAQETLKAAAERGKIGDAAQTMSGADVRAELSKWVRVDG